MRKISPQFWMSLFLNLEAVLQVGWNAEGETHGPLVTSHGLALVEQEVKPCFGFKWKNAKFPFSNKEPNETCICTFKH